MSKLFVEQMAAMFKGMGDQLGGNTTDSATSKGLDLFSEDKARKRAAQLGEGVSFVSSKKISDANWEGLESIYAFKDIRKVHLSERHQPSATPEADSPESDKGKPNNLRVCPASQRELAAHRAYSSSREKGEARREA